MGMAIFTILGAISQLERELIAERVRNGLANARAKGKILGRKKMRNSVLIRELLKSGLSYRAISLIAKCSHGSVHAELAALSQEQREAIKAAKLHRRSKKKVSSTSANLKVLVGESSFERKAD